MHCDLTTMTSHYCYFNPRCESVTKCESGIEVGACLWQFLLYTGLHNSLSVYVCVCVSVLIGVGLWNGADCGICVYM